MSRWLGSVRPKTAADDDDWTTSTEADQVLAAVHRRIEAASETGASSPKAGASNPKAKAPNRGWLGRRPARARRVWLPVGAIAGAASVAVVLALTSTHGPTATTHPGAIAAAPNLPAIRPAAMLLSTDSSCANLLASLRTHTVASVGPYGLPGQGNFDVRFAAGPVPAASAAVQGGAADASGNAGAQTSTTNVQETGVDEPDIVKTDGDRLITITDGVFRVVSTVGHKVAGSLDLTMYSGWRNAQLLVYADHALVILGGGDVAPAGPGFVRPGYAGGGTTGSLSTYLFVDLSGPPKITGSLRASGSYLDARLVGATARLVVRSAPTISFPNYNGGTDAKNTATNQSVVRRAPLTAWLPQYSISTGADTTKYTVPCSQVNHPAQYTGTSLLTIYTLDLTHLGTTPKPLTVAADGDTVYATGSSLYIASNPNWYCCQTTTKTQQTEVHRFDISGSSPPSYLGSGSVPGRLLSQYSLSDYAGSLRIATTTNDFGPTESSSVYVLNADTLKATGHVEGLGKGEQIYAVRFIGPVAYVVTFRQTDPLYVVDLHDPYAPKTVGTLPLTGYSDYLHDAGAGRLIGVGQEASTAGMVAGLQVSLFDVSKPGAPTRTGHVVRPDALGEQTLDPHAFLYWQPTGLVVVPVQSWTPAQSGQVLVLSVSGATLKAIGLLANPLATGATDDGLGIQRSLIVSGALWTVSGSGVQITDPVTLTRQAWIPFS